MHKATTILESLILGHREVYDYVVKKNNSKHRLKSLYSTQIAQGVRESFKTAAMSAVSLLGEIKLYLYINLKYIENSGAEK